MNRGTFKFMSDRKVLVRRVFEIWFLIMKMLEEISLPNKYDINL